MAVHYVPPTIHPKSNMLFMSLRHTLAAFTDAQLAAFRPRSDMQRAALRQELQRRSFEIF